MLVLSKFSILIAGREFMKKNHTRDIAKDQHAKFVQGKSIENYCEIVDGQIVKVSY